MRIITFTADDRRALAHDRYFHPDPRVQRKMEVLWLKSHGLNHDDIAAYADVSRSTVQRYLDEYIEGGLSRLRRCCWHQPQSTLVEHEDSLEEFFLKHPPRSAKQARARIEEQTGIRRGLSQVRHFLKDRLGLRWRKTGAIPVPPKKTVEEHARDQARFLQEKLEPRLEQARLGRRQVLFVDAAHFVLAPFLGCLWCAARLFVRAASGRKRYNILGAIDAVTHRLIRVTNDGSINAESVCTLLRSVAAAGVGLPITLVLDNARYQKCALVQGLVSPARKPALNSQGMFSEPGTHLLIGPGPFKGMGVPMVVFWTRSQDMRLELLLTLPGRPFQVIMLERMDEDFRLVQPRRIGGRIPGSSPALTPSEIRSRVACYVTCPAVLDQEDAA